MPKFSFPKIKIPRIGFPKFKIGFPKIAFKRPSIGGVIYWVIAIGLAAATLIFARNFVTCWRITNLPGMLPLSCYAAGAAPVEQTFNPQGTPLPAAPTPTLEIAPPEEKPPEWDGGSRVNVLFIGIDARDINETAPRSDTMILFTLDPVTKTAGMLSIPRDMWVNIPGSTGYGRINTAYSIGAGSRLPGGGPGLAMKTVEQFIGVPVNYYAQVDFNTFVEMVDTIGGIDVVVKERLVLDPVGTGMDKVVITPGYRHLVGWKALAYARTRHTERGDVDRAQRQQDVIFAIMDKVFSPDYFPTFVKQAPMLYNRMQTGIHTNLSFEDGLKLAILLKDVKRESIKVGVIDEKMAIPMRVIYGGQEASVLKPITDKIRVLRDDIFGGGAISPMAAGGDPLALVKEENARVRILNGTFTGDFGQRTAVYLQGLGINVAEIGAGNASERTVVVLYSPKLYTMRFIFYVFGLNGNTGTTQVKFDPNPNAGVDVEIRLGTDVLNSGLVP